jgi:dihydrodipicolinate synthase/N-acetylneuraminate lyase
MGEAFHLTHEERVVLFKAAREALDEAGLSETVIIAGTYVHHPIPFERG